MLDVSGARPVLLRPGGVTREAIEAVVGEIAVGAPIGASSPGFPSLEAMKSPGLLVSHYAPGLKVRLGAVRVAADEGLLAFGVPLAGASVVFQLSAAGDLTEAAANLFAGLRWLDAIGTGMSRIAVMPVPMEGLGLAINDRLSRAAAPRA